GVTYADLALCLPEYVAAALREAVPLFDRRLKGFATRDAVLTGVETRSSSPVRVQRDDSFQSNLRGIYPCGEGAGYAGGIMSAAVDGMRCAEAVLARYS
ncbi:MAG: FAD-dependent protein, partial [Coriobacteriia bacterium]